MNHPRPKSAGPLSRSSTAPRSPPRSPQGGRSSLTEFWSGGSPKSDTGVANDMLDAKLTRKRAESDLQLLANRIALLRLEEQRALTKVTETKQRADEVAQIKKRNEDITRERMQKTLAREQRVRENQIKAQIERDERQRKLQRSKQSAEESRRALVEEIKEEKRRLSAVAHEGRYVSEQEKYNRAQEAREKRNLILQERERLRKEKEEHAQMLYMQKLVTETQRREQAEGLMTQLEREERELISRLRKTQQMQEKAYSELQKSLRA